MKNRFVKRFCILLLGINLSIGQAQKNDQLKQFILLSKDITNIQFENPILETSNMFIYLYENLYIGSGVSIGDINNDGLQDIYFSSTMGSNKLYLNQGNFKFIDITEAAGVTGGAGIKTGVNMVDINADGYLDIFISKSGYKDPNLRKKVLYINNHNLTFTDQAAEYGLADPSFTTQSYFFDFDNDGDLDVYFLNHPYDFSKSMTIPATQVNGKIVYVEDTTKLYVSDRLFENTGNKFTDITAKAGLINHAFGLSASIADINRDGWSDIYVANDFNKPDFLYINGKNGTFKNELSSYLGHVSFSSMGSDISDFNNDGYEDIVVVDMAVEDPVRQKQLFSVNQNYDKFQLLLNYGLYYQYPRNSLQLNNGNGTFSEIANYAGIAETEWSWSPLLADFDNDGFKDLYITNGLKRDITDWDYKVFVLDSIMNAMNKGKSVDLNSWLNSIPSVPTKNYFYHNNGSLKFDNYTDRSFDAPPSFSNGAAYGDLNNDGHLDLVVNNIDGAAFIFKNNSGELSSNSHYLRFRCYRSRDTKQEVYGTMVKLTSSVGKIQIQHYNPQRGFLSTMEHVVHFGTSSEMMIPKVEITFPNQKRIVLENVNVDQEITVYESDAVTINVDETDNRTNEFKDVSGEGKFKFTHIENEFIDFKREPLIPYKCSRKGPYYAIGDVNGDKKDDLYIGGSAGFEGKLMIQGENGLFTEKKQTAFSTDKKYEDMDAVFFDSDADGDNDLYVISGGSEFEVGSNLYQDRLYLNDGKGSFSLSNGILPVEGSNGSCVTTLDFDLDGDLDLFVGGHVMPGVFPKPDRSMLLQNNKGIFTNVTDLIAKDLVSPGIVNQAEWVDLNNDGINELTIIGEWMPLQVFSFKNVQFNKVDNFVKVKLSSDRDTTINMDAFTGWWYNMKSEDMNGDGLVDIVVANRGLNSTIKGNLLQPSTIYAKDFDANGSYDAVLGYYIFGKCYPLFSRDQLIDQIPSMRKKFIRYKDYSGKTMDDIFTVSEKMDMDVYKTNFFESGVLINKGNGMFSFKPFPESAQLSTINDLIVDDMDKDGLKDIIICGNSNDPAVMVGVYDATSALLLKGSGDGSFQSIMPKENGLTVRGQSRKMVYIKNDGLATLIFLKNEAPAQVFIKQ